MDQWSGTSVRTGSYLFDQKIIPDFAFKIITAYPEDSVIGENTSIEIVIPDVEKHDSIKRIKSNVFFDDVVGQEHIIGEGKLLYRLIKADKLTSIILYLNLDKYSSSNNLYNSL